MNLHYTILYYRIDNLLPEFSPCLLALAVTALLVTFTNSFPAEKKIGFQFCIFGALMAGGVAYLLQQSPELFANFWAQFIVLPPFVKFAMSFSVIGFTYFGGALYSIGLIENNNDSDLNNQTQGKGKNSPALSDSTVTFTVPENLPMKDKEMFEFMFEM